MKVYIEIVLIDNLLIDYLLLVAVGKLTAPKPRKVFLLLSAIFGTIYAVMAPMKQFLFLLDPAFKIISSAIMICIAFGLRNWRELLKLSVLFWLFSLALGGIISGIGYFFGSVVSQGGILAVSGPPLWLLLLSAFTATKAYGIICRRIKSKAAAAAGQVEVIIDGVTIPGIIDSGNDLYEPLDGTPVIIVPANILPSKPALEGRSLPFKTISGQGTAALIHTENISLLKDGNKTPVRAYIATTDKPGEAALVPLVIAIDM